MDVLSGPDARSEREQDSNDKTPNFGTLTDTHDSGGLLRLGDDSSGNPIALLGGHGFKLHNPIADEHHPDASTSGHAGIHPGDSHANPSCLDGSGHVDADPRADDQCADPRCNTNDHSVDHRRPDPDGHP